MTEAEPTAAPMPAGDEVVELSRQAHQLALPMFVMSSFPTDAGTAGVVCRRREGMAKPVTRFDLVPGEFAAFSGAGTWLLAATHHRGQGFRRIGGVPLFRLKTGRSFLRPCEADTARPGVTRVSGYR